MDTQHAEVLSLRARLMTGIKTPVKIEDLTPQWFTQILSLKVPGTQVLSAEIADVIRGTALKARVRLRYNEVGNSAGLPATLIVKGGFGQFTDDEVAVYHIEAYAYAFVVPELEVNAPKCWYVAVDDSGYSALVLEDLTQRPVTFCRATQPLNYEQTAAFLDAFARMHAKWWNTPEFLAGGKFHYLDEMLDGGQLSARFWVELFLTEENWARVMATSRCMAVPQRYRDRVQFTAAVEHLRLIWRRGPFCIGQGDEHLGNLFMDKDGRPGILDWQSRKAPWSYFFSYFLIGALDIEDRRKWDKALLSYYLTRLAFYGVTAPHFDDAWLAYRQSALFGLLTWINTEPVYQPEVIAACNVARFSCAALDLDIFGALGI